ncbi:RNA polymerase sigma factor [Hydrogenimonas urashimensis]|uniref:RNA polymerase sigma factor n=1 Tax=Hydrogenimonas urashimensis TaxID=2740515 RepID=UPI001914DA90|nr:sigma-70 family RNA polymerase sigma factor [Hydrogenimonas urashimensis]
MDAESLKKLTDGDKESWERFVRTYAPLIRAMVSRTMSAYGGFDAAEVDDLVQSVYTKLVREGYRLLKSYDPKRASLSTWLGLVSRSTTIDYLRSRKRHLPLKEETASPIDRDREEERIDLPKGLLSARQELVLRLLFDKEMDPDEVADFLGVEVQTVRSTKHKALERLRRYYKDAR